MKTDIDYLRLAYEMAQKSNTRHPKRAIIAPATVTSSPPAITTFPVPTTTQSSRTPEMWADRNNQTEESSPRPRTAAIFRRGRAERTDPQCHHVPVLVGRFECAKKHRRSPVSASWWGITMRPWTNDPNATVHPGSFCYLREHHVSAPHRRRAYRSKIASAAKIVEV